VTTSRHPSHAGSRDPQARRCAHRNREGYRDAVELLADEHEGVAAVLRSPQLGPVGPRSGRSSRWSPSLDVVEIRLDLKPQASSVGRADPTLHTAAALDSDSIKFLKGQKALDLDPRELIGEHELRAIGGEQTRPAVRRPLPARAVAGLAKVAHLTIMSQMSRARSGPSGRGVAQTEQVTQPDEWTCSHLSISNPRGRTQGDLPRLLRRLATRIAALGPDTLILDVTLKDEVDENGSWWAATVYYARDGWKDQATADPAGADVVVGGPQDSMLEGTQRR
jgi:hypothetical protein